MKVEEKITYFLSSNCYKKWDHLLLVDLNAVLFCRTEASMQHCCLCTMHSVQSQWLTLPTTTTTKKLATTDYHHEQHQHLSPNHFVVALPQRHLEHRSPRWSIQLARNQAKRWRHSTKSIFSLYLPHPPIIDVVDNAGPRCSQSLKRVDRLPLVYPVQPGHFPIFLRTMIATISQATN